MKKIAFLLLFIIIAMSMTFLIFKQKASENEKIKMEVGEEVNE